MAIVGLVAECLIQQCDCKTEARPVGINAVVEQVLDTITWP